MLRSVIIIIWYLLLTFQIINSEIKINGANVEVKKSQDDEVII